MWPAYLATWIFPASIQRRPRPNSPAFEVATPATKTPNSPTFSIADNPDAATSRRSRARPGRARDRRPRRTSPARAPAAKQYGLSVPSAGGNDNATDGFWKIDGRRQAVYALKPINQQASGGSRRANPLSKPFKVISAVQGGVSDRLWRELAAFLSKWQKPTLLTSYLATGIDSYAAASLPRQQFEIGDIAMVFDFEAEAGRCWMWPATAIGNSSRSRASRSLSSWRSARAGDILTFGAVVDTSHAAASCRTTNPLRAPPKHSSTSEDSLFDLWKRDHRASRRAGASLPA